MHETEMTSLYNPTHPAPRSPIPPPPYPAFISLLEQERNKQAACG